MKEWILVVVLSNSVQTTGNLDAQTCMNRLLAEPQPVAMCVHEKFPNLRIVRKGFEEPGKGKLPTVKPKVTI